MGDSRKRKVINILINCLTIMLKKVRFRTNIFSYSGIPAVMPKGNWGSGLWSDSVRHIELFVFTRKEKMKSIIPFHFVFFGLVKTSFTQPLGIRNKFSCSREFYTPEQETFNLRDFLSIRH